MTKKKKYVQTAKRAALGTLAFSTAIAAANNLYRNHNSDDDPIEDDWQMVSSTPVMRGGNFFHDLFSGDNFRNAVHATTTAPIRIQNNALHGVDHVVDASSRGIHHVDSYAKHNNLGGYSRGGGFIMPSNLRFGANQHAFPV